MMVFFQPSNMIILFSLQIIISNGQSIGDMHLQYSGSVVKAMAGAKHLCQVLNKVLDNSKPKSINRKHFFKFKRKIFINYS